MRSIYHDSPAGSAGKYRLRARGHCSSRPGRFIVEGDCTPDGTDRVTCDETRDLFDAWYDGELDAPRSAALARHLEECPGCSALSNARSALSEVLVEGAVRFSAPAAVGKKIDAPAARPPLIHAPRAIPWRGIAIAASFAFFAMLGWNAWLMQSGAPSPNLENEIVSNHIRSLMANHLS